MNLPCWLRLDGKHTSELTRESRKSVLAHHIGLCVSGLQPKYCQFFHSLTQTALWLTHGDVTQEPVVVVTLYFVFRRRNLIQRTQSLLLSENRHTLTFAQFNRVASYNELDRNKNHRNFQVLCCTMEILKITLIFSSSWNSQKHKTTYSGLTATERPACVPMTSQCKVSCFQENYSFNETKDWLIANKKDQ